MRGEHVPFISGHNRRKKVRYIEEDRGYRTPCWIWQLGKTIWGYGTTQSKSAHRIMYERTGKTIPEGMDLDHKCRVRECVNPDHLEPVPNVVNVQRGRLAKLAPYGVLAIFLLVETTTLTKVEIADILGVSPATVFAVQRGQTWKNYTQPLDKCLVVL
jgi:hypothetical protein